MNRKWYIAIMFLLASATLAAVPLRAQLMVDLNAMKDNVRFNGELPGEFSGRSLAYGFIDDDDFEDLVIGAPSADTGRVYIIYGDSEFKTPPPHQFMNLPGPTLMPSAFPARVTVIKGEAAGDRFGWSVATGDVDNDGRDDVIVGAPFADVEVLIAQPIQDVGKTYVIYSDRAIAGVEIEMFTNIDLATVTPADVAVSEIRGATRFIRSGWSVASGDIDNDGYRDVLIGAPFASEPYANTGDNRPNSGAVYVVYGSSEGFLLAIRPIIYELALPAPLSSLIEIVGEQKDGHLGWSVAGGNVNKDDSDDVIMGAPDFDGKGKAYVVSGIDGAHLTTPSPDPTPFDLLAPPALIATVDGLEPLAAFGWSVAAGAVAGSGYDDLLVGAPRADEGALDIGNATVFFAGSPAMPKLPPGIGLDIDDSGFRVRGIQQQGLFGFSVAAGDISNDGQDDILVGAPGVEFDPNQVGVSGVPTAYAIFNEVVLSGSEIDASEANIIAFGDQPFDSTGYAVAAGNLNNKGGAEFTFGAPTALSQGQNEQAGRTYIVYGCDIAADFAFHPDTACVGQLITFEDMSTSPFGPIAEQQWDFGDSNDGAGGVVTHSYDVAGSYTVTLTAKDVTGCKATISKTVIVVEATAAFTVNPEKQCQDIPIQFADTSIPSPFSTIVFREWHFGDSSPTENIPNPMHLYDTPGTYTVTLSIEDSRGCRDTTSHVVEIFLNPTADFKFPPRKFCVGDRVKFKDESKKVGEITAWKWDFDDVPAAMSTEQNPAHRFQTAGTHNVKLEVELDYGNGVVCTDDKVIAIEILPADPDPPLCEFHFEPDGNLIVKVEDQGSGIAIIEIVELVNGEVQNTQFKNKNKVDFDCNINDITLEIMRVNPNKNMRFAIKVTDCCGNITKCDPVSLVASVSGGYQRHFLVPRTDHFLYVNNSGLQKISLKINKSQFELVADQNRRDLNGQRHYMPFNGDVAIDLTELLSEENNSIELEVYGPEGTSALIVFADVLFGTSSQQLPQKFALYQNYPNPFNPTTTIEFTVPESSTSGTGVDLNVYNMFGQEVKTLVSSNLQPGVYAIKWDGHDRFDRPVASGIYIYRIRMGDFTQVRRMMLLK